MAGNAIEKISKEKKEIVDLEDLILNWALDSFNYSKSKEQAKIPNNFIHRVINWKHCKFQYTEPDYSIVSVFLTDHKKTSPSRKAKHVQPQILFKTHFTNTTDREQEYSFKAERSTRSSCVIGVERGVTTGGEFGLSLKTPCEVLEANAGFKRELSVTNFHEDCIEEELTWGVDSTVRVPPKTETIAQLVISEAQCGGTFTMQTRFSGRVLVNLHNMKDNNSLIAVIEGNVSDIVQQNYISRGYKALRLEGREVICETKGSCQFKFGVEQHVHVAEQPLEE